MNTATDYPAISHRPVTERHARYCRDHGHATHSVNDVLLPFCPRCGVSTAVETNLHLRPGEVCLGIIREGGPERCKTHPDMPVTQAWFCWDHRITSDWCFDGPWTLGEDRFQCWRHSDGSVCMWASGPASSCFLRDRCTVCGAYDSHVTRQEAYGDDVTCSACGDHHWYSIGD